MTTRPRSTADEDPLTVAPSDQGLISVACERNEDNQNQPQGEGSASFSETLLALSETSEEQVSLGDAVEAFGAGALGAALALLGLINMLPLPPGSSTVLGFPLMLISWQLARGKTEVLLPSWVSKGALKTRHYKKMMVRLGKPLSIIEKRMKVRLTALVDGHAKKLVGGVCIVLSVILMLPIWGGNFLPALIISMFGLGLMERDGLLIFAAWIGVILLSILAWMLFDLLLKYGAGWWDRASSLPIFN